MTTKIKTREIAARLRELAKGYPNNSAEEMADTGPWPDKTSFRFGTFKVSCFATRPDIEKCAAKFDRSRGERLFMTKGLPRPQSLRRPPDADKRLAELLAECN